MKLFVLAGHRNMEGERAFVQDLQSWRASGDCCKDNPTIAFKYSLGGGYKVSDGWEPLGPAGFYDTFGPELSFGAALASRRASSNFAIAKFTHSGSQIIDWTPEGSEAPITQPLPGFHGVHPGFHPGAEGPRATKSSWPASSITSARTTCPWARSVRRARSGSTSFVDSEP